MSEATCSRCGASLNGTEVEEIEVPPPTEPLVTVTVRGEPLARWIKYVHADSTICEANGSTVEDLLG